MSSILFKDIPPSDKLIFKMHCLRRGISMKRAFLNFIRSISEKDEFEKSIEKDFGDYLDKIEKEDNVSPTAQPEKIVDKDQRVCN